MNSLRKKIRRGAISCLALTMSATLFAGTVLMDFGGRRVSSALADTSENVKFTDITGQIDTSSLVESNFNSSVQRSNTATYETRTVIISLDGNSLIEDANGECLVSEYINTPLGRQSLKRINNEQSKFLNSLSLRGIKYTLKHTYSALINAVAIEIDTSNVAQIKKMGGVEGAVISRTYAAPKVYTESGSASNIKNNTNVYDTGIYKSDSVADFDWGTGAGTVVAVLDTGLDYTHEAFQTMPNTDKLPLGLNRDRVSSVLGATSAFGRTTALGGTMTVDDVYLNDKVPFAFDYADNDVDVYPSYSNHGAHVAGIVAGYDENGYDKKINNDVIHISDTFKGVAPDAQLVICKTFTDNLDSENIGGALTEDILAALEDCVALGVDVINMSLGTTSGFTSTDDGDDEGEWMDRVYKSIQSQGISLICAASNDYSAGFGSVFGTNLTTNPDSATVGSPSTYFSALSVASINGQCSPYMIAGDGTDEEEYAIFYDEARDGNSIEYDFDGELLEKHAGNQDKHTFEYVVVGKGQPGDYSTTVKNLLKDKSTGESLGRLALIERGNSTFLEKIELAYEMGAIGAIIYNNVSGTIRMSLGDIEQKRRIPAVSITQEAGNELVSRARLGEGRRVGEITIDRSLEAGPFMSDFSSWGTTPDLKIKPEITAHGGEIISTVPGGYGAQSGTSMASPNMAGLTALVRNYVKTQLLPADAEPTAVTQLTNQLLLSTATNVVDPNGLAYSPRKQGAGLASLDNIVKTRAYLYTDASCDYWYDGLDGRPKVELGADKNKKGEYTFSFKIKNFGESSLSFDLATTFMTESLSSDKLAVAEKAHLFSDIDPVYSVSGATLSGKKVTVEAGKNATITVTVKLSNSEKKYIDDSFVNGMFVEGFVHLKGTGDQCDLNIPFLSFYGDWDNLPMLDYDCFDIADSQRDTSVKEEDKLNPMVFATQAYASYGGNKYVIPIGNYVYVQDENADQIYTTKDYGAISRFDETVSDDGIGNYYTANQIRCLYAGLLRNAWRVDWSIYNAYTGELISSNYKNRISKAYANGGAAVPGFVELKLTPEELGLVNNGKYRMKFDFYFNEEAYANRNSVASNDNSFEFDFYLDYDAPVLQDARVRYEDYTDGNKIKQNIYIDLDIYDNHYPQSVMLAYIDNTGIKREMKLATDYFTPVQNPVKNGVTTVSIDVTNTWEQYKNSFIVQIDDYALNHSTYALGPFNGSFIGETEEALNANVTPATFDLAEGESEITVGVNETHTVALVYEGDANISNFEWTAQNSYVKVKNGEIVGVRPTGRTPATVTVSNRKGVRKDIKVTVVDNGKTLGYPSISFDVISNYADALVKASGYVRVHAGKDIQLSVLTDPWYYPNKLDLVWSSDHENIATVDQNGKVHTITKGNAIIKATIRGEDGKLTAYAATVSLAVQDEFTVDNFSLTAYHGDGIVKDGQEGVVEIPDGKNIMTIGERAFLDNTKITKVIIPKSVTEIGERAFEGCTNLREVCFVSDEDDDYTADGFVSKSELKLIRKYAFKGCGSLETLDLRNCKVISVAYEAFANCVNLKEIIKSTAIGTAYDRAFMGCSSLQTIDLSGLHVAGKNVFSGCTALTSITTDKFTAIGDNMFTSLHYVYQEMDYTTGKWNIKETDYEACNLLDNLVIKTDSVGTRAFDGCKGITNVKFEAPDDTVIFKISDYAFRNCTNLASLEFSGKVKSIGAYAFANTALNSVTLPDGLTSVGVGAFDKTPSVSGGSDYKESADKNFILSQDGKVLLLYIGNGATCTIPSGVEEIASYAFAGSSITSLTIPANIVKIGEGVFQNSALASINIQAELAEIPAYTFFGTKISSITLPASVTYVGDYAFGNSSLTAFNFTPESGAEFGSYVFSGCKNLVNIALDSKISVLGDVVFGGCTALETVTLPALEYLGSHTFIETPALKSVTFASGAKVTGNYTFIAMTPSERENLTSVTLGTALTAIGEGAFYNCASLASINLGGAEIIEASAFFGCSSLATVTGLDSVKTIGTLAFYNSGLKTLNLAGAEHIGNGAFMVESGNGAYTSVTIPKAITVGSYAFAGGEESAITLPATLKEIGGGAFAASKNLTSFSIDAGNKLYFKDENGVLYRYITDTEYELVAYPLGVTAGTLSDEYAKNKKTYTVLDGTISIAASAFEGLKSGAIEHVVLPYTLKIIGSSAFFNSGIKEYRFESINAPVLLTDYMEWIKLYIEEVEGGSITYIGYFYSNFEDYFVNHSEFGDGLQSATLTIYRPENGVGYNTHIYSKYFANHVTTGINIDDTTREVRDLILKLPTASEVSSWNESIKSKPEVEDFSELVKRIRTLFNTIDSQDQLDILGQDNITHLEEIEVVLRDVKKAYGIPVIITRVTRVDGSYKNTYYEGEVFDMKGLQVIVHYDDSSTEIVGADKLVLVSTDPLTIYDQSVVVTYNGVKCSLVISVSERTGSEPGASGGGSKGGCNSGCNSVTDNSDSLLITFAGVGALLLVASTLRRKKRKTND